MCKVANHESRIDQSLWETEKATLAPKTLPNGAKQESSYGIR